MGCMPSEEEPPDSAPEEVQDLPGLEDGDDGVDEVESSPFDEAPIEVVDVPVVEAPVVEAPVVEVPVYESPIEVVASSPESPVDASPVYEAPVQESPIEVVDASPESPVEEAQDEEQDEAQSEVERVADTLDKSFGANGKGEGVIGSSNTMGDCKYDGSLGMSAESKEYQAECMRLNMAECIMGGSHGACTYVAAEGSTIGCMWDGTGCDQGCIPANMVSRCAELSHDLEACDGEQGQELRCKWSKPGAETMGYPAEGAIPDAAETMGLPPQPRPKIPKSP